MIIVKIKNNMTVCILGTGLSSLALAAALVKEKIYVDLVLPKKSQRLNKSRTLGISKSNIEFFNKYITNIEKICWKLNKIDIFSENLRNEKLINFEKKNEQIFSIIKNYQLYKILKNGLTKSKYFKKIDFIKNENLLKKYNLVINTDYFHPITKKFFSKKIIKNYNSFAYITTISHDKIVNNTAVQIFTKKGPLAFLPISHEKTSIVFSVNELEKKQEKNIKELIHKYNYKYRIKNIKKIEFFKLKSLNLRSYYHQKYLAFGDLLHRVHPLAGQGFNMTIRDIKTILKIIKNRKKLGLSLDKSINIEFEKKIKHKNFIFTNGIDFVHEFFNLERKINSNLLSKSVQLAGKNPTLNKIFSSIADKGITF